MKTQDLKVKLEKVCLDNKVMKPLSQYMQLLKIWRSSKIRFELKSEENLSK